jgi:hypothetical protein
MAHSTPMTTPPRRSLIPVALVTALLVAACGSTAPSPVPSASGSVPPATASAPPSTAPSPATSPSAEAVTDCDPGAQASPGSPAPDTDDPNAALYSQIEAQVSKLRGITATKPVERGVFDKPGLCAYLTESFDKDNPPELVAGTDALYKAFGLMPQEDSLRDLYLELLTSQVAGLYDDDTKKMYVVTSSGEIGPAEQITYAHEYTHALQDQKFTLKSLTGDAKDQGDRSLARSTLIEGDATLLMSLWAQQHLTAEQLGEVAGSVDPASEAVLARMPAILKDALLFPYTTGLTMTLGAFQQGGGYGGVDGLFATPPDTTEQVMHPEKLESRESPVAVSFPDDFASKLGEGWTIGLQDTLGEFQLRTFLADAAQSPDADAAAAGWGGDRVAWVTGPGGANAAVLDTRWDSDADAAAFADALGDYVAKLEGLGRAAAVLTPAADRVVVISANDADTLGKIGNALGLAG